MDFQSALVLALALLLSFVRLSAVVQSASADAASAQAPQFVALVGTDQAGNLMIELGVTNRTSRFLQAQDHAGASWELLGADGRQHASGTLEYLPRLAPGEASFPLVWNGRLEPGHYTLTWGSPQASPQQTRFRIVDREGRRAILLDQP